jgi:hypothetical protein
MIVVAYLMIPVAYRLNSITREPRRPDSLVSETLRAA